MRLKELCPNIQGQYAYLFNVHRCMTNQNFLINFLLDFPYFCWRLLNPSFISHCLLHLVFIFKIPFFSSLSPLLSTILSLPLALLCSDDLPLHFLFSDISLSLSLSFYLSLLLSLLRLIILLPFTTFSPASSPSLCPK